MTIMEHFTNGKYYDFQVKNGKGFILNADGSYEELLLPRQNRDISMR